MTHSELVNIAWKWATNRHGVAVKELVTMHWETADVLGFTNSFTTEIECKVSVSDFKADQRKLSRRAPEYGIGNYRIYCVPKGLLTIDDLPEKWGLLEVYPNGRAKLVNDIFKCKNRSIFWWEIELSGAKAQRTVLLSLARRAQIRGYMPELCKPLHFESNP